jgi:hypothetical protein
VLTVTKHYRDDTNADSGKKEADPKAEGFEVNYGDSRILGREFIEDDRCLVIRAVVDVDVPSFTSKRQRCGIKHLVETNQAGLLVVERYYEINCRHGARWAHQHWF